MGPNIMLAALAGLLLVVGIVSVLVLVYLVSNLVVDILYAVLDPRIRYE